MPMNNIRKMKIINAMIDNDFTTYLKLDVSNKESKQIHKYLEDAKGQRYLRKKKVKKRII